MTDTPACNTCNTPLDLSKPHVTFTRQIETERVGTVDVEDSEVLTQHCLTCA